MKCSEVQVGEAVQWQYTQRITGQFGGQGWGTAVGVSSSGRVVVYPRVGLKRVRGTDATSGGGRR